MGYKVINAFTDLQDNNHLYTVGDIYPRDGVEVLPSRIKELASTDNKRGEVLIQAQETESKPVKKSAKKADNKTDKE